MKFNYQARTKFGEIQSGVVEASSKEAAINLLKAHQLYVTALNETAVPFYRRKIKFFEKISRKEIVAFSRQLAIMFKSEIPLIEILQTLAKQTQNPIFREKILGMTEKVEGGSSLSKTFSYYPGVFSPFYINMVKSGEASGKLSEVFSYLADHLEKDYNFNAKIKGAMIYPIFLSVVFILIMVAMAYFVMPQLTQILTETGQELPIMTKILIGLADFLREWVLLLLLVLVFGAAFIFYYFRTKEAKDFFDKNLLKLPVLGNFLKKMYLSRFALNLSTLISGGLPIVHAIEITGDVVGNETYRKIILETAESVRRGERVSDVLQRYHKEITPLFTQMVVVGEKTGRMDLSLLNIVSFYEKDVDRSLDNFMQLLEPILIIFFGIIVIGLMIAVIVPLYQIVSGY